MGLRFPNSSSFVVRLVKTREDFFTSTRWSQAPNSSKPYTIELPIRYSVSLIEATTLNFLERVGNKMPSLALPLLPLLLLLPSAVFSQTSPPQTASSLRRDADLALASSDYSSALSLYNSALSSDPTDPVTYARRYKFYNRASRLPKERLPSELKGVGQEELTDRMVADLSKAIEHGKYLVKGTYEGTKKDKEKAALVEARAEVRRKRKERNDRGVSGTTRGRGR